jgi:hypothetical protein
MTQLSITIPITKRRKVVLTVEEAREVQRQLNEIFPETKQVPEKWVGPVPAWPAQPTPNWPIEPTYCGNSSATPLPPQPTTTCENSQTSTVHNG